MYRFRKENWARKVDGSYPKHWSKSNHEYGFFMEQPSHMAESQFMETHSDRVRRSPYIAPTFPRARMSVADKTVPRRQSRIRRKRVGVHYDYDNGNDMWDVLRHRENSPTGIRRSPTGIRRRLQPPRSLSPIASRRPTLPNMNGASEEAQSVEVENPWFPMLRTNTAVGRGFGRISHSRHGYEADSGRLPGEPEGVLSRGKIDDPQFGNAPADYGRAKTPRVAVRNGLSGNQTGIIRNELIREPTRMNLNDRTGNKAADYSRANTPGLNREYTLGPRLHTMGPREYHGLPEPGQLSKRRPEGHLENRKGTAVRRGRSLSPVGNRNYSAATNSFLLEGGRIGSPVPRMRKPTLNERFFRFNFHEPWKASIRT